MQLPLQITARDLSLTDAIESAIRARVDKLNFFYDRIMGCRVAIEAPHRHQHKGLQYKVRVHLTLPGGELTVRRALHEDLYVAIRDAFDAAKRQLQEFARRRQGKIKHHEGPPEGQITELERDKGYGFIVTADGREVYFHENSVLNADFDRLEIGAAVRFNEERGEEGPQASSLAVL